MKIYLAGRYSRREELARYADELREMGIEVTSRWLSVEHQVPDDGMRLPGGFRQARAFAQDDVVDLIQADMIINFTEPPRESPNRGGRHVEFGIALGVSLVSRRKIRLIVVGHRENVFHCLEPVAFFSTWENARNYVAESSGWLIAG